MNMRPAICPTHFLACFLPFRVVTLMLKQPAWNSSSLSNHLLCCCIPLASKMHAVYVYIFTITAEIHARSLANFYCQYADRHMNLKFMRRVSEREPAIRQFVIVKNKLMSVFNASVLLLIMNFVIALSK